MISMYFMVIPWGLRVPSGPSHHPGRTGKRPDRHRRRRFPFHLVRVRNRSWRCGSVRRLRRAGSPGQRQRRVMAARWSVPAGLHPAPVRLPVEGELPPLDGATGWLNSPPLSVADLRGRVVVVGFWTYTCINWLRQLPYLRAWAAKYAGHGLVVVGVHTPEFTFETDVENIDRAVRESRIEYPVAIDSGYRVWRAFDNHYWPALYFADAEGRIRHHHFGEGAYPQSEMVIQQLLTDAGHAD